MTHSPIFGSDAVSAAGGSNVTVIPVPFCSKSITETIVGIMSNWWPILASLIYSGFTMYEAFWQIYSIVSETLVICNKRRHFSNVCRYLHEILQHL